MLVGQSDPGNRIVATYESLAKAADASGQNLPFDDICEQWYLSDVKDDTQARKQLMKDLATQVKHYKVKVSLEEADTAQVNDVNIKAAEDKLGVTFPDAYIDYLKDTGALTAGERKLTGLGVVGYQNVVDATLKNRRDLKGEVAGKFMVEDLGAAGNGVQIWSDGHGKLYTVTQGEQAPMDQSFDDYLSEAQASDTGETEGNDAFGEEPVDGAEATDAPVDGLDEPAATEGEEPEAEEEEAEPEGVDEDTPA